MLRPSIRLAATTHGLLRSYAPTNILLDLLRTRPGLKWTIPVTLVLAPAYLHAAILTTTLIAHGAPSWLNLLSLMLCWNAIKFTAMVPLSVILLTKARIHEWHARRAARREGYAPGRELGPITTWS